MSKEDSLKKIRPVIQLRSKIDHNSPPSRRNERLWVIVLLVLVVAVTTPLVITRAHNIYSIFTGNGQSNLSSYGGPFENFHSLKESSTIVVQGSYTGINSTYNTFGKIITIFSFSVVGYVKGSGPATIQVLTTTTQSIPVLPITGQKYVLFLNSLTPCPASASRCTNPPDTLDNRYIANGGPEGTFLVENNRVFGFKSLYPSIDSWIIVDADGTPLNDFISMVVNA